MHSLLSLQIVGSVVSVNFPLEDFKGVGINVVAVLRAAYMKFHFIYLAGELPVCLNAHAHGFVSVYTGMGESCLDGGLLAVSRCRGDRSRGRGDACGRGCAGGRALHMYAVVPVDIEIQRIGEVT